ncbi:hypothetical protein V865_004267 [Kwoniella europaea PYCC6329]|uniref:Uncharacterized protein n=1 Tax=Kwoniella europaea PYCC6329 TaxID=1423913 RepID=A0AAX4KI86_9TREE
MSETMLSSQEAVTVPIMKEEDSQSSTGVVQNVGAKRRMIDVEVQSNDDPAFPPVQPRYPNLSHEPPSTTPPSAGVSTPTSNRMITRSLSKSQFDLLNRAQTATPSNSVVSDSLRQVSSTTTISRAYTQSPTLTLKQPIPIPRVDQGVHDRRVFSQPNFHPGSVPYQDQILNHPLNGFATEQTYPAVQQLHQAHQTIQSLQSQLNTSTTAIHALESRVINYESLLSSKSVDLDQARNEIQSLRFQLHQQSLGSVSRHQLNEEKSRHSKELDDMRARLGGVVKRVNSEREGAEGMKRGLREDVERLHCEIQERNELIKDDESVNKDLFKTEEDLAGLRDINKVLVRKIDELTAELKKKDQDISSLQSENAELRGSLGKSNKDITLLIASKEALNRVVDTYRKTNQELQSDLTKEKERSEEIRKVGWEQLNALRKEYGSMKNRHEKVTSTNEEIKRSYEIVCQSEKAAKHRLNIERDKFNDDKVNWEKGEKSKKGLRDQIDQLENDLSNTKKINQEISEEKTRLKEYDHLDIKCKERAKLNQVLKAEVKGLKKGNATVTKKVTGLEKSINAHQKQKQESNRQIEDLKSQNEHLQSKKQLLARTVIEVSESCEELEEIKTRLEERVIRNDHKLGKLDKFVSRISYARSKYHHKIELKNGANLDSSKAQFEELKRTSCSIRKTPNFLSARERKRQDRLLKIEMKRSKIPQKLDWLDYWIRLVDFAFDELEDRSVDQLASDSSQDDHPVTD